MTTRKVTHKLGPVERKQMHQSGDVQEEECGTGHEREEPGEQKKSQSPGTRQQPQLRTPRSILQTNAAQRSHLLTFNIQHVKLSNGIYPTNICDFVEFRG